MTTNHYRQKPIVIVAILAAAIAAVLLMGYDSNGWIRGTLGYVLWVLMPYAILLVLHFAICTNRLDALSAQEAIWSFIVIAFLGPLLYVDIRFLNPDAQGAMTMLIVPIVQCAGIVVILAISLLWYRLQKSNTNPVLSFLNKSAVAAFTIYLLISALQHTDAKTIDTAREIDFFINQYCEAHGTLPTRDQLQARFPGLNRNNGWFFYAYNENPNWLKMQYPVKWSNKHALGEPKTSEFTATTYSYTVEYHCGSSR